MVFSRLTSTAYSSGNYGNNAINSYDESAAQMIAFHYIR